MSVSKKLASPSVLLIGFIRSVRGWVLSPAFDINPEPALDRIRSTAVFGETGASEASGAFELACSLGVSAVTAQGIAGEVLKAMEAWRTVARANGCKEGEMHLFDPVFCDRRAAIARAFGL